MKDETLGGAAMVAQPSAIHQPRRLLRIETVLARTGLKTTALYGEITAGRFPPPRRLTPTGRAVGWDEREVDEWIDSRPLAEGNKPWTRPNAQLPPAPPSEKPRTLSKNGKVIGRPRRTDICAAA